MIDVLDYCTIDVAATMLGVSKSTLRNWDRIGKFSPTRHPYSNYRLYSIKDLKELQSQIIDGKYKRLKSCT